MSKTIVNKIPHVMPYQGSKRKLAKNILEQINFSVENFYEPFAGSAAVSLAAATQSVAKHYVISDKLKPLTDLWTEIIQNPDKLVNNYRLLWQAQLAEPNSFYNEVRDEFNNAPTPAAFLYLVARCVKNSIRFNADGKFNQSPDNRRLGMKPSKLAREAFATSKLLQNKVTVQTANFQDVIRNASPNDVVYMDPPWQGTSSKRDPRYAYLLDLDELIDALEALNKRSVPYLLSFDGSCGQKDYGQSLPEALELKKILLHAGRSSQATLLGREEHTVESLYVSPALSDKVSSQNDTCVERMSFPSHRLTDEKLYSPASSSKTSLM